MSNLPVLIGSRALVLNGIKCDNDKSDYDLIVSLEDAYKIAYYADMDFKRLNDKCNIYRYQNKIIELHIWEEGDTNHRIYNIYNKNAETLGFDIKYETFDITSNLKVKVADLYTLYTIKRSHIHRVLPITNNDNKDRLLWERHVEMYANMRDKLAETIGSYSDIDGLNSPRNIFFANILNQRIQEVNNRVGDSKSIEDATVEDFFKDNVPRIIDHDLLHEKVAAIYDKNWKETGLLFRKFFKHDTDIAMDKDLFMAASTEIKNMVIIQEIMVLYIERKWLPCVRIDLDDNVEIKASKYNNVIDLREIIIHYVTNLAGSNWLRYYAIDHYKSISNLQLYNSDDIWSIVLDIFKDEISKVENNVKKSIKAIFDSKLLPDDVIINPNDLKYVEENGICRIGGDNEKSELSNYDRHTNQYIISKNPYLTAEGNILRIFDDVNAQLYELKGSIMCIESRKIYLNSNIELKVNYKYSDLFCSVINNDDSYLVLCDNIENTNVNSKYLIYNLNNSQGILIHDDQINIVALKVELDYRTNEIYSYLDIDTIRIINWVSIRSYMINSTSIACYKTKFDIDEHISYYTSYSCGGGRQAQTSGYYLSKFGKICEGLLSELSEYIARVLLGQYLDCGGTDSDTFEDGYERTYH